VCRATNREVVRISPAFYRPAEVESLIGDFSKAERELQWRPKTNLDELCRMMVDADIERLHKRGHIHKAAAIEPPDRGMARVVSSLNGSAAAHRNTPAQVTSPLA
jgi:hypothetical protein